MALPLADQTASPGMAYLYGAAPRGEYRLQLFEKGRGAANVLLEHPGSGALLGFELPGAAEARMARGAVATPRVGKNSPIWTR
jgi:hypothetical protein